MVCGYYSISAEKERQNTHTQNKSTVPKSGCTQELKEVPGFTDVNITGHITDGTVKDRKTFSKPEE